ncbi:hypothetical protein MXD97_29860, partial [Klebsiella pneumoniae]|nr:hypothetical protein [Klebsiella pneumoniae]
KGSVQIKNRTYKDNTYNDVDRFYPSDASYYTNKEMPAIVQQLQQPQSNYQGQPAANNYQQPAQNYTQPPVTNQPQQGFNQQPQQSYQPGAF